MAGGDQGFQIVIDPTEWYRLKRDLDKFDPALARALRRRIRNAGQVAADSVKKKLGEEGSGPGRQALIDATRVSVSFGKTAAGARIVTSANRLPAEHKGLLLVYNKTQFRHPLFGDRDHWYSQQGHPYFRKGIYAVMNREVVNEIRAALDEAVVAIGGRGK